MTVQDYLARQNGIYQQFQNAMATLPSVYASPLVAEPASGYIIAWTYSDALTKQVAQLNRKINKFVSVMQYDNCNAHTTSTVYQLQPSSAFQVNNQTLHDLTKTLLELDAALLQSVLIQFNQWLFKEDAIIAAGQPNDAFWLVGEAIQSIGKRFGLDLRMPWGAHMTIARYLENSSNVAGLKDLINKTPVLGQCQPESIFVGHFSCGTSVFSLHKHTIRRI